MRMAIAENLHREMEKAHITQYALEKLSGVPQPTIQRILKGSDPRASTVQKLAEALQITPARLIGDSNIEMEEIDTSDEAGVYIFTDPGTGETSRLSSKQYEKIRARIKDDFRAQYNKSPVTNSELIATLKNKASPRTRALLQKLAVIDRESGLNDEHIEILEHLVSRYETDKP